MQKTGVDASFVYNENGLRVQKTVNGVVTDYTLHGKNIVHMTQGDDELHFFYDAQNRPAVVVYNGVAYTYAKSLQGDIIAILDGTGAVVVAYTYDAWGKPISKTGSMANTLGTVQPFRYRGYVYDEEIGLYYLRSRYYTPIQCRFINADALVQKNTYAYCSNSPAMRLDTDGYDDVFVLEYRNDETFGTHSASEPLTNTDFVKMLKYMVQEGWMYPGIDPNNSAGKRYPVTYGILSALLCAVRRDSYVHVPSLYS